LEKSSNEVEDRVASFNVIPEHLDRSIRSHSRVAVLSRLASQVVRFDAADSTDRALAWVKQNDARPPRQRHV
jgi:hypothetical protein